LREAFIPNPETCPPITPEVPNTSIFVSPERMNYITPLVRKTLGLAGKTSKIIGKNYMEGFVDFQTNFRNQPTSIVPSILQRNSLHLPSFELHDRSSAKDVLSQAGYEDESISQDGILLLFKLPHLSSIVWRNIDMETYNSTRKKVGKTIWARLGYDAKMAYVGTYELYEKSNNLSFRRINEYGHHDPEVFYYLHEVTDPRRNFFTK